MPNNPFNTLEKIDQGHIYSLPKLEEAGVGPVSKLPVCIRVILESLLRNCDGAKITEDDIKKLANWNAKSPGASEIPFVVSRIVLQDFTGVPLLVDLAAMRDAVGKMGKDAGLIEPLVPVDLVIDHSVQVDRYRSADAFKFNMKREFERNKERYEFLKWGQQSFKTFNVIPPAVGIVHQVNLEYLAKLVFEKEVDGTKILYPDTLVGTDSHTTMINGLGVVGWGVGGIEAEAGMLGQPIYLRAPEVIGVHLTGDLREGVTATDMTLRITEMLRKEHVVGKFVEFFGPGASALTVADRATIGNMAPEYGATIGYFPIDQKCLDYMRETGRSEEHLQLIESYYKAQGLWGIPQGDEVQYTKVIELNLVDITPSVAGPKRPQDRIDVPKLRSEFERLLSADVKSGGFAIEGDAQKKRVEINDPAFKEKEEIGHGAVVIAAITSCTNTSNPSVMMAAGLVAKKAVENGLKIKPTVKTSLAPGSRVVTDYFEATDLQQYFDTLGFNLVGYGCTTCIGNSGPLDQPVEAAIKENDLIAASVLSGNRNFEARVHPTVKASFLMSPPLVVAYALAGTVHIDLENDPIGVNDEGKEIYLKDLWPSHQEVQDCIARGIRPEMYSEKYKPEIVQNANPEWNKTSVPEGTIYEWNKESTYIQNPPFFTDFSMETKPIAPIMDMRPLALLGDSVTTDHISPAGAFPAEGPAGQYLLSEGVEQKDFNSFGSRRGNDKVMTRGTFANVRIKNLMADGKEGGYTKLMPDGELMPIYDACMKYAERKTPLIVIAGGDYGMGSSRDWAAKGTALLGVKAVIAESFERIHRSNLLGMGVLPLQFQGGDSVDSLELDGTETFSLPGLGEDLHPQKILKLEIKRADGETTTVDVVTRIDTEIEGQYYRHGGILPYVLREILETAEK